MATYAERNEVAKAAGYKSYAEYTRLMRAGLAPTLNPTAHLTRPDSKLGQVGFRYDDLKDLTPQELAQTLTEFRMDASSEWSRHHGMSALKYDNKRAERDIVYRQAYYNFAHEQWAKPSKERYVIDRRSKSARFLMVEVLHLMTDEDWLEKYGEV